MSFKRTCATWRKQPDSSTDPAGTLISLPRPSARPWLALAAVLAAAGAGAGAGGLWNLARPTGSPAVDVSIEEGMSARAIGVRLEGLGLVRSARAFEAAARWRGLAGRLEAGRYRLDGSRSPNQLLDDLLQAPPEMVRVTIPEGLTRRQVAGRLRAAGQADSARFVAATESLRLIAQLGVEAGTLEGYLFPETYFLPPQASEEEIVRHMVAEFFRVFDDSLAARLPELGLSLHEAVTLASIVEGEAMAAEERPVIAAIFHRRLSLNRRLESCATVEYALGVKKARLTHEDLRVLSPYNTYRHGGLPPGPICSPGRASLRAALNPPPTDYFFFVARGDGTHEFSRTNREHEAAKREIRRRARLN